MFLSLRNVRQGGLVENKNVCGSIHLLGYIKFYFQFKKNQFGSLNGLNVNFSFLIIGIGLKGL
jgi:hypothetical protein